MNRSAIGTYRQAVARGFAVLLLAGSGLFGVANVQSQEPVQASLATPSGAVAGNYSWGSLHVSTDSSV